MNNKFTPLKSSQVRSLPQFTKSENLFSKKLIVALLLLFSLFSTQAATITSTATGGTWATASTWVGGVVPATGDAVIIATTGAGSVNIGASITQTAAGSVTVNDGARLTVSNGTLIFGSLNVSSLGTVTLRRSTTILGATNISGKINFGSTSTTKYTMTFTGAVTLNNGAVWDETNAGTNTIATNFVLKNNFINNATSFIPLTGSVHTFNGTTGGTLSGTTPIVMPRATFTANFTNNTLFTANTLLTVTAATLTNNGTITALTSLAGTGGVTQGATGILNIGKTSAITTLTATAAGNIVNYNGVAQTVHTGNYHTLNLSGSGAKTLTTGTTLINSLSLSGTVTATTVVNLAVTNDLLIGSGCTFTTGTAFSQNVGGVTSISGSMILGGTGAKSFTGDVTINSGGIWNETGVSTVDFGGNFTNNATAFTANSGMHNFVGGSKIISGATATVIPNATFSGAYTINSVFTSATQLEVIGTVLTNNATVTAAASLTGTGTFLQGTGSLLNIGGAIGIATLNAATGANTVNYTGSAQTAFMTTYSNLIVSGTGIKTFATSPLINAILSMEGTATVAVTSGGINYGPNATLQYNTSTPRTASYVEWITPFIASGGVIIRNTGAITTPGVLQTGNNSNVALTINAGATLNPGSNLINLHGDFINNGTLTSGSGGITFSGTSATQSIGNFTTTGTVALNKNSGTATLVGNVNGGALTINGSAGTLNLGIGLTHTFAGIVTLTAGILNGGSSTLNENAISTTAWNGTGSVFVPAFSTVNFAGGGNQTIAANSNFYNLGFLGSGTKTLSNVTTVVNNFSVNGTAVANLGTNLSHSSKSLTLGSVNQAAGSWGSTVSPATNKNATWFGSTATGVINVSCSAPAAPVSGGDKVVCSSAPIPSLTVTVTAGQTVDWYTQSSGGTLLLSGSTSYTPTAAGTYFAEARDTVSGCSSAILTSVKLTINPTPVLLSLTGSTICVSPGNNGTISSTTSQTGINYQLYNSGNATVQTAKPGTGNSLVWSSLSAGNGYYIIETNATTGCSSTTSPVNVLSNPNPTALILSGSTICSNPGGDGIITSTTSQTGISYQLYDAGNTPVQTSQPGTGNALIWTTLDAANGYYAVGTNSVTGCTTSNSNAINITTIASPVALVLTGSTICASPGGNGTITSTTSATGVSYQLNDYLGNDIGSALAGTGSPLTFTGIPAGTEYFVEGTSTTTNCVSAASNSVDVLTNANPVNKTITVSSATVCSGTGANIIVAGSLSTETYQLRNSAGNTNIGSAVTGNGGSLNLPSGSLTSNTTFNVLVTTTASGCTTLMSTTPAINVNALNTISLSSATGTNSQTVCLNTAIANITYATTGATGATFSGLPAGVTGSWSLNVATITGTPSTATGSPFNYIITMTGGCTGGSNSASGTIAVNPNNTAGSASSSPTLCINSALPAITHTTAGATGIGSASGLPTGVTASWASNTITISGMPTASGVFNYNIALTGGCGTVSATGTITVTANNTAGIASSTPTLCFNSALTPITHPTTGATGISNNGVAGANGLPAGISASWSGNVITISGTPAASGVFNYSIPLTGGCGSVNAMGTITVTTNNTASSASSSPTLCINSALSAITHTTTGATGIGSASGLPMGISASWASNTISISGTPTESGTFNYTIPLIGGCGSVNASGTIIVQPNISASVTISVPTNIICAGAAAPVTFTASPVNGGSSPFFQWKINGNPTGTNTSQFTTTILVPNDVVTVTMTSNASPCLILSPATSNSIVIITQTTIFDGTWSLPPAANLSAEIRAPYSISPNLTVCSLTIQNNAPVTLKSGDNFTIQNGINIAAGSSLKIESDANLIQINDAAINSGNITSEREFKIGAARSQYNYLGSPVAFQAGESYKTIFPLSTTTPVLFHNQVSNTFSTSSGANIAGRGSAVKEPPVTTILLAGKTTAQYKGVPQNGEIILPVTNSNTALTTLGYNLVGNPFASNIDLRKLYDINGGNTDPTQVTSQNISPTFYFWDNNNNTITQQQGVGYQGQSYALFNVLAGSNGTGTAAGSLNGGTVTGIKIPTKIVKVGQGFMTRSLLTTYNFKFNNSIRVSEGSSTDFLGKTQVQDDRFWLKMTAPSGIISTIAIVHYRGGNDRFGAEDSRSVGGSDAIYSLVEDEKIAIEGRSSLVNTDRILLGTKHFVSGTYTIAIDTAEGVFGTGQNIYLKDKYAGIISNLSSGNYTFNANAGESSGRFEIIYRPEALLATDSAVKENVIVFKDALDFIVRSSGQNMTDLQLYDANGRLILQLNGSQKEFRLSSKSLTEGLFIIKITLKNGEVLNRKIRR